MRQKGRETRDEQRKGAPLEAAAVSAEAAHSAYSVLPVQIDWIDYSEYFVNFECFDCSVLSEHSVDEHTTGASMLQWEKEWEKEIESQAYQQGMWTVKKWVWGSE